MKRTITTLLATAAAAVTFAQHPQPASLSAAYSFIENKGQITDQYGNTREDIDFRFSADDVQVFVGGGKVHYQWLRSNTVKPFDRTAPSSAPIEAEVYRMDVMLLGANEQAQLVAEQPMQTTYRYYTPPISEGATAATYGKITYKNVYPNIDWVVYSKNGKLEYDFVVHPGGRVADIQIAYEGASTLDITATGQLMAFTPFGSVTEAAPYSYNREGQEVASAFTKTGNVIGFTTGSYTGTLTIDPVVSWVSYYGGNGLLNVLSKHLQDQQGNIYMAGMTTSFSNIATVGAHQTTLSGNQDAFLAKFNTESMLQWGTYFGGSAAEWGYDVALDTLGHVYLTGETGSTSGISTPNSFQPNFAGGGSLGDVFIAQFDTSGARIWSTYYGGTERDYVGRSTTDGANLYVVIPTTSTGLATAAAHKAAPEDLDHLVVKFNASGQRLWATYFGGPDAEGLFHPTIVTDAIGDVYFSGLTASATGIATPGAHQTTYWGNDDLYLAKMNPEGALLWSTYYGGSGSEENRMFLGALSIDKQQNVLLGGGTESASAIATPGAHQSTHAGSFDAFVAKFTSSGSRLWGTYVGGTGEEAILGITATETAIYAVGHSNSSTGIATPGCIDSVMSGGSLLSYGDAILVKLSLDGQLEYGTYFGNSGDDLFCSVSIHEGHIYATGVSSSVGLGTPGTWQPDYPGGLVNNILLARFCTADFDLSGNVSGPDSVCSNETATYTVPLLADVDYVWEVPQDWTGSATNNSFAVTEFGSSGTIKVYLLRCEDTSAAIELPVTVHQPVEAIIEIDGNTLSTVNSHASYQWHGNGSLIPGATADTYEVIMDGSYFVVAVDSNGCVDTSEVVDVEVLSVSEHQKLAASVKLFPNPATETLHIQSAQPVIVTVSGIIGQQLKRYEGQRTIDVSNWQPGTYLLKIYTKDHVLLKTEKLVKLR